GRIARLDKEPLLSTRAHETPRSVELLAAHLELDRALAEGSLEELPRADVPDHHGAAAVFTRGDDALEARVLDRVVLDLHREPFDRGIERWPLRHRPRT